MAIVRRFEEISLEKDSKHPEVEATYCVIENSDGRYLQIDIYGSGTRQIEGKKVSLLDFPRKQLNN